MGTSATRPYPAVSLFLYCSEHDKYLLTLTYILRSASTNVTIKSTCCTVDIEAAAAQCGDLVSLLHYCYW